MPIEQDKPVEKVESNIPDKKEVEKKDVTAV